MLFGGQFGVLLRVYKVKFGLSRCFFAIFYLAGELLSIITFQFGELLLWYPDTLKKILFQCHYSQGSSYLKTQAAWKMLGVPCVAANLLYLLSDFTH